MKDFTARPLAADDVDSALRLCDIDGIDGNVVRRELAAERDYCWMGLFTADGTLASVHRGMRWHERLLLKGLFVDERFQASGAGLRTVLAVRDWASRNGFRGVLAWVEPSKPEAHLARRLRMRCGGPRLHRYLIPLPHAQEGLPSGSGPVRTATGTLTVPVPDGSSPAVEELLGVEQCTPGAIRLAWVLDRSRLVLSGNPCDSVTDLDTLVEAAKSLAPATGATSLEVPFEAADLHSALWLAGNAAKRLSRTPVSLGFAPCGGERPAAVAPARNAASAAEGRA
ncbi:hypothetical protein [Streptomyces sp. WMMB 322]|uniref:hypothetical protein n=1 Tax=Streptomyces sp. WMMB 322 TaxID=1286821 RepID=UPI0006E35E5F|nr:hypothetical protein [Streptomyces sp. WMMB 322]SCK13848.1 hypothetical protein H180DRAFT_00860 [Streptomyces sp. WMMB 322]